MHSSEPKKKSRVKRVFLACVIVLLAAVIVICLAAAIYVNHMLSLVGRSDVQETLSPEEQAELLDTPDETVAPDFTGPVLTEEEAGVATEPAETVVSEDNINILLVGQDRRAKQGRGRSDSMILCTFNREEKTLTMTSFLRDMYVTIPDYFPQRINVAYALGGFKCLDETLEYNFGVTVDGNVEIDFYGFMDVIDLLGGVDIELTASEAKYLNNRGNWDVEEQPSGWTLREGMNHLNGSQTLAYSRIRYLDSDFGRTNRQRTVLTALLNQCKNLSISQINSLLVQVLPMITTDLTNTQIFDYAMELLPMLFDCNLQQQQIPASGTYYYASIKGMSIISVDLEENREILRQILD